MVSDIITPGETPPGSHGLTDVAGCISHLCSTFVNDGEEILHQLSHGGDDDEEVLL